MHCHLTKFYFYPLPIVIPVLYKVAIPIGLCCQCCIWHSLLFRNTIRKEMHMHRTNPFTITHQQLLLDPQRPQHFCGDPTRPHLSAYATSVQTIYRLLPHVESYYVACTIVARSSQCYHTSAWRLINARRARPLFNAFTPLSESHIHSHQAHFFVHFRERSEISSSVWFLKSVGRSAP